MPSIFGKSGAGAGIGGRAKPGGKTIRGTISGPIAIPGSMDDDEFPIRKLGSAKASTFTDDEFPIRRPGTGIATPLPLDKEPSPFTEDQVAEKDFEKEIGVDNGQVHEPVLTDLTKETMLESPSNPPRAPSSSRTTTPAGNSASRPTSRSPPNRSSPRRISPNGISPSQDSPPRASPQTRRATNPALSPIRYSAVSDAPSKQTTQSRDVPQRKKSTLRSALGRLFGRGRKKTANVNQDPIAEVGGDAEPPMSSAQHRSDPTALSRPNLLPAKRSVSLPISEFDRPLRSHSIGPGDIMAIESARNSVQLQAEAAGSGAGMGPRRRANTTTSRMLFQQRLRNPEWGAGLSPRPASAQGRGGSGLEHHAEPEDPNEIGRAITSDSGNGLRRRSRSLSGLQDIANSRPTGRRRSDEIRFWRQSYDPMGFMSPLSSNAPEDIDDTGVVDMSVPDSPAVDMLPTTPPQPFNFGLMSKEMIGMKITHAADIDTRLAGVESRTHKLERVVTQLCHSVPGFKGPFGDDSSAQFERISKKPAQPAFAFTSGVPPSIPALYNPIPTSMKEVPRPASSRPSLETADTQSQLSFGDGRTFIGSLHPPSSSATQSHCLTATAPPITEPASQPPTQQMNRPTSTSTVRDAASLPTLVRDANTSTTEDSAISQLKAELETERAARQDLEAQVRKLSERLNSLSTTVFAMIRGPSEARSQERLASSVSSSAGGSSPLLQPPKTLVVPPPPPQEQLSVFEESDDEEEDDDEEADDQEENNILGASSPTKTDVTEDDFQTPREELRPPLSYGAFGEELRPDDDDGISDDDHKRKKAARTLSLSQLTLGKGQRAPV